MVHGVLRRAGILVATAAVAGGAFLVVGGSASAAPTVGPASMTRTAPVRPTADNIIRPRATLERNQAWTSGNGRAILRLQEDGNLVLYKDGRPVWQAPNSWGRGNTAVFQEDGNFVVYDQRGEPVWASDTYRRGSYLAVQDDGNLVIYNAARQPIWATNTGD